MTELEYQRLILPYGDARDLMRTRLNVLKHSLYGEDHGKIIHNIQDRIKSKLSIEEKLWRKNLPAGAEDAKNSLLDIAGLRVICYFIDDIYTLVNTIRSQSDIIIIKERDYIREPKENGYRSYHLIVGVPLYYVDAMEYYPVEIQFRTLSMDFWASMEHRILYKKEAVTRESVAPELREYADQLHEIELRFQLYSSRRERNTAPEEE